MLHYGEHTNYDAALKALFSGESVSLREDEVPGLQPDELRTVSVDIITTAEANGRRYEVEGIAFDSSKTALYAAEMILGFKAIIEAKLDAVVGYTQRFRRRWLVTKEKVRTGALGEVTMVTSRGFMNRLVALDNYKRTDNPSEISPMVISGTHALDMCMWMLEAKTAVEVYARSVNKALKPICDGIDGTAYTITFSDDTVYSGVLSWGLPEVWPGAVYSLEVGIVGTEGVLTIDDTHRDIVLATNLIQGEGYAPDKRRHVDFLTSYPVGDMALGELRGPMREETVDWLNRVSLGLKTQHATAAEGHNRLMLTKAIDLSARLRRPVPLPISAGDIRS
jgi:predicted dehydrogenase